MMGRRDSGGDEKRECKGRGGGRRKARGKRGRVGGKGERVVR